jgi:hypothetical protein
MSIQNLVDLLASLALGKAKVLTRSEFKKVFGYIEGEADRKQVALSLGEREGCEVLFSESEADFVTFTKRQTREAVRSGRRPTLH